MAKQAKPKKTKVRHLTGLLLKANITSAQDAIKDITAVLCMPLKSGTPFIGAIYIAKPKHNKDVAWAEFLSQGSASSLPSLANLNQSAVLIIEAKGRQFAYTFGYGRNLLKPDCFERDFGLKVVLNAVDPDSLRSIDLHAFEDMAMHTRRQLSSQAAIDAFEVDVFQDLIRAVTGRPKDENKELGSVVTGADAVVISPRVEFHQLGTLCESLLVLYKATTYRDRFPFYDQLRQVKDTTVSAELDDVLITSLRAGNIQDVHLAPPYPMDWQKYQGFHFSREDASSGTHDELRIEDYLAAIGDASIITATDLREDDVELVLSSNSSPISEWAVYDCLLFETMWNGARYVLTCGRWFEVDKALAQQVDSYVASIPKAAVDLPLYLDTYDGEGEYNTEAANLKGHACLDRHNIRVAGTVDPIEPCDLFTANRQFVHVKRKTQSATLSHLFNQGINSAEAFFRDQQFRDELREQLKIEGKYTTLIPTAKPDASQFEVVYAIVCDPGKKVWPNTIPFFSRMSLMRAATRLKGLGYKVGYICVDTAKALPAVVKAA